MSQLTLKTLTCIKKQDIFTKDTVRVNVDGRKAAGDFKLGKNDDVLINAEIGFTDAAEIKLIDVDANSQDETLGVVVAKASQAGQGAKTGTFDDKKGFHYDLTYEVSA